LLLPVPYTGNFTSPMIATTAKTYRKAYSGLSKETWLLSVIMLINRSGTMVIPFMSLYLTSPKMGFTIGDAGFVLGCFGAGAFSGAWIGGKLTDKFGFYPVQMVTLTGGGILFMVLGQMKTFPEICAFTFLLSFVNESFRPANSTAIAFYSKAENRTRSYALNRLAINVGWAVGSGLGGFLAHYDYHLLFWVDGTTNIMAAILMWFTLRPVAYRPVTTEKVKGPASLPAYRDRTYIYFSAATVLFAAVFFQLFTNLPVYFKKGLNLSEPYIGFIMALNGILIAMVEMVLIYKLEGKRRNSSYITAGVFLVALSFMILNIPGIGSAGVFAMILVVTIGEILSLPFMNSYWLGRTQPTNRGQYAAIYTMAWSAAQTLGPLGGAQLAQHLGFHYLWWAAALICLLASFMFSKL
jgi:predicted MFS family arabinose efflux permease